MWADFPGNVAAHADRNAYDDEVRAFRRLGIGLRHLIGDPKRGDALARLGRMRSGDNSAHGTFCPRGARDGRADQATAAGDQLTNIPYTYKVG